MSADGEPIGPVPEDFELRIAVCIPGGAWSSATGHSIGNLVATFYEARFKQRKTLKVFAVEGSILPDVRNLLVRHALAWRATHLLLVDSDMQLPENTLVHLLARNQTVIGANYVQRRFPTRPNAYRAIPGEPDGAGKVYTMADSTGLEEVDHLGLGCVLIDARVFRYVEPPAFRFDTVVERAEDGSVASWHTRGEDVIFFERLRSAGFRVMLDHDLSRSVYHVGEFRYGHEHCEERLSAESRDEIAGARGTGADHAEA